MSNRKNHFKTADAVILLARDISHSNRVVTLLTAEYGVIEAFANGSKNPKSRLMAVTQPLVYGTYELMERGNTWTIQSGEIKHLFYSIRENVETFFLAFYLAELTKDFAPRAEQGGMYLSLFLRTLMEIEKGQLSLAQVKAVYEFRILSISGYMPNLGVCDMCGDDVMKSGAVFSLLDGIVRCRKCAEKISVAEPYYLMNKSTLEALRYILSSAEQELFRFSLKGESLTLMAKICERYLQEQVGHSYQTLEMYHKMLS